MVIKNNIKKLRHINNGMTQHDLSLLTGIPRETIAQYETDRAIPSVGNCILLAEALGVSIAEICYMEENE